MPRSWVRPGLSGQRWAGSRHASSPIPQRTVQRMGLALGGCDVNGEPRGSIGLRRRQGMSEVGKLRFKRGYGIPRAGLPIGWRLRGSPRRGFAAVVEAFSEGAIGGTLRREASRESNASATLAASFVDGYWPVACGSGASLRTSGGAARLRSMTEAAVFLAGIVSIAARFRLGRDDRCSNYAR